MSRLYYTLECGGKEKSFGEWKIIDAQLECTNQVGDSFGFNAAAGFASDSVFAYGAEATLRIQRKRNDNGTYSGGKVLWIGYRAKETRSASAKMQRLQYQFQGIWEFFFEQIIFEQQCRGYDTDLQIWTDVYHSQVTLGQDMHGVHMKIDAQINEIVNFLTTRMVADPRYGAAKFQLGGSYPSFYIEPRSAANMSAGQALRLLMSEIGSTSMWFDYSTSPPTFYCDTRDNLAAITLSATGAPATKFKFTKRDDLMVQAVDFTFRITTTVNGVANEGLRHDIACAAGYVNSSQSVVGTTMDVLKVYAQRFNVYKKTLNFSGGSFTRQQANLTVETFSPGSLDWWKSHSPELRATLSDGSTSAISNLAILSYTVETSDGLTPLGYDITEGAFAPWMSGTYQKAVVRGRFSGKPITEDQRTLDIWVNKEFHCEVGLTSISTSGYQSGSLSTNDSGDEIPWGLAKTIYDLDSQPQYDGTFILRERHISGNVQVRNVLNVSNGKTEWATMRTQIQSVVYDFNTHSTEVTVGVAKHLGEYDFISRLNANRRPQWNILFGVRRNADTSTAPNSLEFAKNIPPNKVSPGRSIISEQMCYSEPNATTTGALGIKAGISAAETGELMLKRTKASSSDGTNYGTINLRLDHLDSEDPDDKSLVMSTKDDTNEASKRSVEMTEMWCYDLDGNRFYRAGALSGSYAKTDDDGGLKITPVWL
jgi:hypothetical protein